MCSASHPPPPPLKRVCSASHLPVPRRFKSFMDRLLWDREAQPEDVYRIKGGLNFAGSETKHFVQVCEGHSRGSGGARTLQRLFLIGAPRSPFPPSTLSSAQAVYELYSITEGHKWAASDSRSSTVVVIGRNLRVQQLQEWFQECVAA